jgi:transcriptional regulator GlxA family with amidase domain
LPSSSVMSRLSETLLVEAVREYSSTLPENETGWLSGLRDPYVGRALALIHGNIGKDWMTEDLAKEVALSRSAFVERFTSVVGLPPIRYLTVWRLRTAKLHLREKRASIAQLAHAVGYQSEEAFSRAFKREFGVSPAHWRDRSAEGGGLHR